MTKKAIAILGTDSSHTEVFASLVKGAEAPFFSEANIVSLWGEDFAQAKAKAHALDVPFVASTPEEAVEKADHVMVLGRFAESHFRTAKAALLAGKPTFVDKPFTNKVTEGNELINLSEKKGVPLFSCSVYRFSEPVQLMKKWLEGGELEAVQFCGPRYCRDLGDDSRFMDIAFYGIHTLEMVLEVMGTELKWLGAEATRKSLNFWLRDQRGIQATVQFLSAPIQEYYNLAAFRKDRVWNHEIHLHERIYVPVFKQILEFFETGESPVNPRSNLMAIEWIERLRNMESHD